MPRRPYPTQLVELDWRETSGVDHPANEADGWLVIKARKPTMGQSLADLVKAEEAMNLRLDQLMDAIEGLTDDDLEGCPANVQQALDTLEGWLDDAGYDDEDADSQEAKQGTQGATKTTKARRRAAAPDADGATAGTEPAVMRKSIMDIIAQKAARLLKGAGPSLEEKQAAAFDAATPDFLADVVEAAGIDDDGVRKAAIVKAVGDLQAAVAAA